ncbi:MAG: CBS domain-containing protein [Anaerolineales bacterium]|jgi:CBS domain-containing protein|uniref:CBS domain-containing protein n=1 Tax=Candidatus Villigracilis proximus TaxID=3140683 RepID=UPI003137192E|nr:CBS domain-containing protein [Anaerolineales bacterium]MBK8823003.1 CBS domain-containing protein [Anaerolineales bacterium]MBK9207756.1 CBS domain-containing protein [Anaerolineales bacterium]
MTTVRKLLEEKESEKNFSVTSTDTVLQALKIMAEAHIGAILVTESGKIVGIYTERDYLYKGEIEGRLAKDTLVKDVMISKMMTVTKDTTVEQCMGLMKQYNVRHLPVVENEHLVGLVSMRDVMFAALENRESEIRGLENYIMGSGFQS